MKTSGQYVGLIVIAVFMGDAARLSSASVLLTENFEGNPYWASLNNRALNDNYGYSPTTNYAGGRIGEAGGVFGRHDAFDSFYADIDLGGTLSVREPIFSSGRISIDSSLHPTFNMNISFFDARDPSKGGDALRIHIIEGGRFLIWLRQVVGKTHQSPIASGLTDGDYQWTMSWNPAGNGGLGSGTVTFNGLTPGTPSSLSATLNMPVRNEPGKPARWIDENTVFNAFGLQAYDAESTGTGQYRVFIDDVSYTAVTAPGAVIAWKLRGSGVWSDSRNWSPGEPPVGSDRTAVFGAGINQNATIAVPSPVSVKSLRFDNAVFRYAVAGISTLTLDDVNNVQASIDVLSGQHQIQTPLSLADDALISASAGTRLELNNQVSLNGHTLTISGGGDVSLNHVVDANGGTVIVSAATLSSRGGTLHGDLVLSEASVLKAEFDFATNSTMPLEILGSANVSGVLDLSNVPKNGAMAGQELQILTADLLTNDGLRLMSQDARWFELLLDSTSVSIRAIGIPEPSVISQIVACVGAMVVLHVQRRRLGAFLFLLAIISSETAGSAALIGQHFNTNPGWMGVNNILPQGSPDRARDDLNNYGYNPITSNALGSPGEIGGYFGMNTFDSYYADTTLGGNMGGGSPPLTQSLWASGKLMVNADHSPTWNMNIGFFDANNFGSTGDAVRIALIELSPGYRLRLEIRQQGGGYNGPLLDGVNHLLEGMYEFQLMYNPTGGSNGAGRLALQMWGPMTVSTFIDVDSTGKNRPMSLNAFGFTNYNSGVSRPDTNKHYTFLDDLVYTTQEVPDPVVRWAGPSGGSWNDAFRWQRTSSADGGGFVPNGSDRTAIFGAGTTGPTTTVYVDKDVRARRIDFDNSNRYVVAGAARLTLDADSSEAAIDVEEGSHEFQTVVGLDSNARISAATGSQLTFQNAVDLNGRTLTIAAKSRVAFNSMLATGVSGMIVNEGKFGGVGRVNGDLLNLPGGDVNPGAAAGEVGELVIGGDFVQSSTGRLAVEISGDAQGEFDSLAIDGRAVLQGLLEISLVDGYVPDLGDRFDVLVASGGIDIASLVLADGSRNFQPLLANGGSTLVLEYVDADFNDDSLIDGADLTSWRSGLLSNGSTHAQGDANGDGSVDGADLLTWQRQFRMGGATSDGLTVPEPTLAATATWIVGMMIRLRAVRW
jgi:hypothetical protein